MKDIFEFGEPIDLMKIPEDEAKAILGEGVYQVLKEMTPRSGRPVSFRISAVNRQERSVTYTWADPLAEPTLKR